MSGGEVTQAHSSDHPRVLVVDDEPNVGQGIKLVLSEEGFGVEVAEDGRQALDIFRQKGADLVLADLRLPDMDGLEVIREIKEGEPRVRVVVITGYPSQETALASAELGVSDYLRKPFSDQEILAAVARALEQKAQDGAEAFLRETQEGRLILRREVLQVLNRAAEDMDFNRELLEKGTEALAGYHLTPEAKVAIASGDLNWLNQNVGEFTQKQLSYIHRRLAREAW